MRAQYRLILIFFLLWIKSNSSLIQIRYFRTKYELSTLFNIETTFILFLDIFIAIKSQNTNVYSLFLHFRRQDIYIRLKEWELFSIWWYLNIALKEPPKLISREKQDNYFVSLGKRKIIRGKGKEEARERRGREIN